MCVGEKCLGYLQPIKIRQITGLDILQSFIRCCTYELNLRLNSSSVIAVTLGVMGGS